MKGGKHLLLLAALVLYTRGQQKPQVSLSPALKHIFSGDLLYLTCDNSKSGSGVKWYHNNKELNLANKRWKISVAASSHSGSYQCESNGQKSDSFNISVLDYLPRASLTINIGQPVMQTGGSVVLQLDNEESLKGWKCWVNKGNQTKRIMLRLEENTVSQVFHSKSLNVPETIFWCTDITQQFRSNQITVRTSEKPVLLEMYPLPAVDGHNLTLKCLAWGTDQISHVTFYKDDAVILESGSPTYKVTVANSTRGKYKCAATFTYKAHTAGPPYQVVSDYQDMLVHASSVKAVISAHDSMSCSCPRCPKNVFYRWYYKDDDDKSWVLKEQRSVVGETSGTYACQAVWENGRSLLSDSYVFSVQPPSKFIPAVVTILVIVGFLVAAGALYICRKGRNTTEGPIYEDVGLGSKQRRPERYEMTSPSDGHDTLHHDASGLEKKDAHYEALKGGEFKDAAYHTLGVEGAGGGGQYEALNKKGMEEGTYHTLGKERAGGGGQYEALNKQGMEEGTYHTLGKERAGGGGQYEALNKQGMEEGTYHTLGRMEGAGQQFEDMKELERKTEQVMEGMGNVVASVAFA